VERGLGGEYKMVNKWNNITKMVLISFFSTLYFYSPILTLYYQKRGLSLFQINSIQGIIFGAMCLSEVPTGIIADRIGRKFSIVTSLFLQLIGEIAFIFASTYWHFAGIAIIAGINWSFNSGCIDALIYDSLKEEGRERDMSKAAGLNGASLELSQVIGPLAGGLVASSLEMSRFILAVIMTSMSVAAAFFISFSLKEPRTGSPRLEARPLVLLKDGVELLKGNVSLRRIVLLSLFASPFASYFHALYQPYFVQANVTPVWLGIARSLGAALAIAGSRYAYLLERHLGVKRSALLATAVPGVLYFFIALVYHPAFSVVLFCFAYGTMSVKGPLFASYQNRHIGSKNRATVLSIIALFAGMYEASMGLVIGRIADYRLSFAFMFMGGVVLLGAFLFSIDESHVIKNR